MIAKAKFEFDRDYFELRYDEWLRHISRFKKFEVWFALVLTIFGIALALSFQRQWLVGGLFALAGVYELVSAITHKRRWVNGCVSKLKNERSAEFVFTSDSMTSTSVNGSGTTRYAAFAKFSVASQGFFLTPELSPSLYIPQSAIQPSDSYSALVAHLSSTIGSTVSQTGK